MHLKWTMFTQESHVELVRDFLLHDLDNLDLTLNILNQYNSPCDSQLHTNLYIIIHDSGFHLFI